jgi:hypothetical protein
MMTRSGDAVLWIELALQGRGEPTPTLSTSARHTAWTTLVRCAEMPFERGFARPPLDARC